MSVVVRAALAAGATGAPALVVRGVATGAGAVGAGASVSVVVPLPPPPLLLGPPVLEVSSVVPLSVSVPVSVVESLPVPVPVSVVESLPVPEPSPVVEPSSVEGLLPVVLSSVSVPLPSLLPVLPSVPLLVPVLSSEPSLSELSSLLSPPGLFSPLSPVLSPEFESPSPALPELSLSASSGVVL